MLLGSTSFVLGFPGLQKVFGDSVSALGDALNAGSNDFKQTGGFDLIPTKPNGFMAIRRESGTTERLSEMNFITTAMERAGEKTGCEIGSVTPIPGIGYIIIPNCK